MNTVTTATTTIGTTATYTTTLMLTFVPRPCADNQAHKAHNPACLCTSALSTLYDSSAGHGGLFPLYTE